MEDVIPESESLLLPMNLSRRAGGGAKAEEGHEANGGEYKEVDKEQKGMNGNEGKDEEEKGGGIITHLISIVSPRGSTPKAGEVTKRKVDFEVDDIGNGGFSNKPEQEGVGGNENSNGGVISNLICNLFNRSGGGGGGGGEMNDEVDKEAEKVMKDIGNKRMKMEEEKEEGGEGERGGIIDNLVCHLPTSLPDDAAPSTDEASILITSIVRD